SQGAVPSGQTLIRFATAGAPDFQTVSYLIVLNTSGNGHQPLAQRYNSDYNDWSYVFLVGGGRGYADAPVLEQVYQDAAPGGYRPFPVQYAPQAVMLRTAVANANVQFGFDIQFDRCAVDRAPPSGTATPSPAPSPSMSASPNPGRVCPPFAYDQSNWKVSLFTVDRAGSVIDSLSPTSATASDYSFGLDTSLLVQTNDFKPRTNTSVQNLAAQIVGVEVFSTP
ncbi:MAG: hypothetical protein QOJ39_3824, partial [Candidatus Eremiobacteraeota bacterium]|nr:hypothetical protein [Candidatus Eremiobacteraeota bacterium]